MWLCIISYIINNLFTIISIIAILTAPLILIYLTQRATFTKLFGMGSDYKYHYKAKILLKNKNDQATIIRYKLTLLSRRL